MDHDTKRGDTSNNPGALEPGSVGFTGNDMEGVVTASDSGAGGIPGVPARLDHAADTRQDDAERARGTITEPPGQGGTPFGEGTGGFGAGSGGAGGGTVDAGTSSVS